EDLLAGDHTALHEETLRVLERDRDRLAHDDGLGTKKIQPRFSELAQNQASGDHRRRLQSTGDLQIGFHPVQPRRRDLFLSAFLRCLLVLGIMRIPHTVSTAPILLLSLIDQSLTMCIIYSESY